MSRFTKIYYEIFWTEIFILMCHTALILIKLLEFIIYIQLYFFWRKEPIYQGFILFFDVTDKNYNFVKIDFTSIAAIVLL